MRFRLALIFGLRSRLGALQFFLFRHLFFVLVVSSV